MLQKSRIALLIVLAFAFPNAVWADINSTATLAANATLNLDTGTTGTSGGDILWTGSSITPQGSATVYNAGNFGAAGFAALTQSLVSSLGSQFSSSPISSSLLVVGDVFGVHTNGGHWAAVLVTANSGSSLTLQYVTFGASSTGPGGPSITSVENNASNIPSGLPNSGVAPGGEFNIKGSALNSQAAAVQSSAAPGLQTTVNGTSISVTVNGTTTHPVIYYTSATQINAVLPSNTPVGTGTITVTNAGQTSSPAPIRVVANAFGIDTFYGEAVAQDLNGNLIITTSSASPGQILTIWGSGLGADPHNDDQLYPQNANNLTNIPLAFYIGGISAPISYRGRSGYPGVDVVNLTVPDNVQPGCNVAMVAVIGNVVSNSATLPVAEGGGTCSDPSGFAGGIAPTLIQLANSQGFLREGNFAVASITSEGGANPTRSEDILSADFHKTIYAALVNGNSVPSVGSCVVTQIPGYVAPENATVGLDAGTITVSTPVGPYTLYQIPSQTGTYDLVFLPGGPKVQQIISDGTRLKPGTYTFTASGGADVGPVTASVNFPEAFTWTNDASITSIDRTQPLPITWSGGTAGGLVVMSGESDNEDGTGASFECFADATAGAFTIPSYVLLALPPSISIGGVAGGTLEVFQFVIGNTFSAKGLDYGLMETYIGTSKSGVTYK